MHYADGLHYLWLGILLLLTLGGSVTSVRHDKYARNQRRRSKNSDEQPPPLSLPPPSLQQHQQQQHQQQLRQLQQHQQQHNGFFASDKFVSVETDFDFDSDSAASDSDSMMATEDAAMPSDKQPYDIFTCCNEVFGSCRTSCENLSLVQLATGQDASNGRGFRLELKKYCPSMQLEFWSCMNRTLDAVARGTQWSGRRCCALGLSPRCRNACATSATTEELITACRQSDEQHMFACFKRQEAGDRCCGNARTSECLQACREIFEPHTPHKRNSRRRLDEACGETNGDVLQCIRSVTDMTPLANSHKYLPCCEYSPVESCRSTCRALLNTSAAADDGTDTIIGELEAGGCGTLLPHLPLWQCFLTADRKLFVPATSSAALAANGASGAPANEVSQINQIGIDAAKLHCCEKAQSPKCRRLCAKTYSTEWLATRALFEGTCLAEPNELRLRQCLDEVDEPCELGCDGLSFCTNFNNRPTELFRSCNAEADAAARSDLRIWQQNGFLSLPGGGAGAGGVGDGDGGGFIQIKNMTRCAPEKWRAIACALQLKPCARATHYNHICREDCHEVLSECMDWTRMNSSLNAGAICARLHPTPPGAHNGGGGDDDNEEVPCISLRPYLEESDAPKETGGHHRVTSPCKGQPCNGSEVCVPGRNESTAHQCVPGCSLGEASNFMMPFGAYVRIPVLAGAVGLTAARGGFKVCRCGAQGRIEFCQPLPSFSSENCVLPGRTIRHGVSIYLECNLCSCFAEEITCTKKQCRFPGYTDVSYTSLPCNCPTHYVPVCGRNGNTYHSACIAKCLGLQDGEIEYGACTTWSPCQTGTYSCAAGMQCLEHRKVCLSTMHRPCLQYKCVNQTTPCDNTAQPVCDSKGYTHASACDLLNAKAQFAHWGACYRSCSWKGPVCGINGVTYAHECTAWADFILVDYRGRCREVGLLAADMGRRCRTVKCATPVSPYCRHIVPPGACCPICGGGAFRVIYSRKQIDRALYALRGKHKDLLTLASVLRELDALVQVAECQLAGFLTMEVGVFVAVVPRTATPTRIQIEVCTREAEKISVLIESQSHRITTNLVLSGLITAHMLDPSIDSGCDRSTSTTILVIALWCVVMGVAVAGRRWLS